LFHPFCPITSQILDGQSVGTCLNHATSFPKQEKVKQDIINHHKAELYSSSNAKAMAMTIAIAIITIMIRTGLIFLTQIK